MNEQEEQIRGQLKKLQKKYEAMGQDMSSYLDGLLYANYLSYWEYIHLDTLLSLQDTKTDFPDEKIFVTYHQITELYFKLILHELQQIAEEATPTATFFHDKLHRINRYFEHLVSSFDIMVDGMEREQFLLFRMSLLPASGFQSVQYRKIELMSTDLRKLVKPDLRRSLPSDAGAHEMMSKVYWKQGAKELASGEKTLTLKRFEQRYETELIALSEAYQHNNLWQVYRQHFYEKGDAGIIEQMKKFDQLANIQWPLAHFRSAARYLQKEEKNIAATGGTNWQKYLPPRFQGIAFFPPLWSEDELKQWGRLPKSS